MRQLFFWCTILSTTLCAQNTFHLKDCLDYAFTHNLELANSNLNQQVAHYERKEVIGSLYPQIQGSFGTTYNGILRTSVLPAEAFGGPAGSTSEVQFGTAYESTANLQLNQQLFNPALGTSLKLAEQNKLLQQTAYRQTEEQVAYNVAILYYNIIIQDAQQANLVASLKTLDSLLIQGQLQLEQGVTRQVDVDRLQVNANALEAQIEQLKRSRKQLVNSLKIQLGMPLATPLELVATDRFLLETQVNNSRLPISYARRPDVQMMEIQANMTSLQKRLNQQGYLPTLSFNAQAGSISNRDDLSFSNANWNDYLGLTLNLTIPIFAGFQKQAKNQQFKAQLQIAENNLRLTEQQADYELKNAETQYDNTKTNLEQQRQNVALAAKVFDISQLEYAEGIIPATSLTEARNDLTEAQNIYYQTLLEQLQAQLEMAYAQGHLVQYLEQQ